MGRVYLEDGCRWCGSQEWNDELTDVEHAEDCPVPVLAAVVDQWTSNYHCCPEAQRGGRGHGKLCPLASAKHLLRETP